MQTSDFAKNLESDLRSSWNSDPALPDAAFNRVFKYFLLLIESNQKVNFFSRKMPPEDLWRDHILDSATALPYLETSEYIVDFGCGGGLPGMVLSLCIPDKKFFLFDKSSKKIHYLKQIAKRLGTKNLTCSDKAHVAYDDKLDTALMRAVGTLAKGQGLLEQAFSRHLPKQIHYKARREKIDAELEEIAGAPKQVQIERVAPADKERHLVILHF